MRYLVFTLLSSFSGLLCSSAHAEFTTLDDELSRVVEIMKQSVESGQSIRVEPFSDLTAGSDLSGSIKTGLSEAFAAECQRQNLIVNRRASYIVRGEFFVTDAESLQAGKPLVLELHWSLKKRTGQTVVEILPTRVEAQLKVDDPVFLAQAVGLIGIVSAGDVSLPFEPKQLAKMAINPTGIAEQSFIRAAERSDYVVEIRARRSNTSDEYQPLVATVENGMPFVDIPKDYEYQIWIYNHSSKPVAVAPSIDGLSTFHFADGSYHDPLTGKLKRKHYVLPPSKNGKPFVGRISGWHLSDTGPSNVGRFLVSNYGDSAAGQLSVPEGADTGAIHLQFCRCKEKKRSVRTRGIGDEPKGTAIGERETVEFKSSNLVPGEAIEFLTIRYDR